MKYLSKLSRRMAQMHLLAVLVLPVLGGCKLIESLQEPISYDALNPPDETIPLPPTSLICDNEPAGFTRAIDAPMNVLPSLTPNYSSEGFIHWPNQTRTLFIEQSPTAPQSPNSVLRVVYPRGARGGESPSRWGSRDLPATTGSIYVCGWIRYMPGWSSNGNVGTKLFFIKSPSGTNHFVGTDAGAEHSHAYLMTGLQFNDDGLNYNLGQAQQAENDLAGGGWHKFEVVWEANTPGVRDGKYSHWVDGRLIGAATDVRFFLAGQQPRWTNVWFDPTFGGGFNTVPFDQFFELDHLVVSSK
jgi:hypothetical protein